jgi:hypothetical protein
MNIADLNDADLQALDELNCHHFQAMDPSFVMGLGLMRQVPKVTSRQTCLMMGRWMMWPLPCLPLLEAPRLRVGSGNPCEML